MRRRELEKMRESDRSSVEKTSRFKKSAFTPGTYRPFRIAPSLRPEREHRES